VSVLQKTRIQFSGRCIARTDRAWTMQQEHLLLPRSKAANLYCLPPPFQLRVGGTSDGNFGIHIMYNVITSNWQTPVLACQDKSLSNVDARYDPMAQMRDHAAEAI